MKIKITRSCLVDGQHQEKGTELSVPDAIGRVLIQMNRATLIPEAPSPVEPSPEAAPVETPARPARKKVTA